MSWGGSFAWVAQFFGAVRRPGPGAMSVADFYNFGLTSGPPTPPLALAPASHAGRGNCRKALISGIFPDTVRQFATLRTGCGFAKLSV